MHPLRSAALLLGLLLSAPALAHDVSLDLSAGSTRATNDNPRSGFLGLGLGGSYELSDSVSLSLGANLTRDLPTPPPPGSNIPREPPTNVFLLSGGADWLVDEHWVLSGLVSLSPRVNQAVDSTLTLDTLRGTRELDILLGTANSSLGLTLAGGYATAGDSNLESSVDVSVTGTRYATTQRLLRINRNDPDIAALNEICEATPELQICRLRDPQQTALAEQRAALTELRLSAGYTATLFSNTDVGLEGAWFLYDSDPTEVGYFSLVSFGRNGRTGPSASVGDGIAVAPLLFTVRPQVSHRMGAFTLRAWFQHGRYVEDLGVTNLLGLRLTWRLSRELRLALSANGQRNADQEAADPPLLSLTTGLLYRF